MEKILELNNVSKVYPSFNLKNVSFNVKRGEIMGFIGRNGAGKSTTLKAIMNLITFTGSIKINNKEFIDNEVENKQNIAFILGGVNVYQFVKVKTLAKVTGMFYNSWDNNVFNSYLKAFNIDKEKMVKELSQGMKVKLNLALALSHKAKLLILDEPTSGLDPVSRDEILQLFLNLVEKEGVTILFSTQIVSDLDRCADSITYIRDGSIIDSDNIKNFIDKYRIVKGDSSKINKELQGYLIGYRDSKGKFEGLIKTDYMKIFDIFDVSYPNIEDVMIFNERKYNVV